MTAALIALCAVLASARFAKDTQTSKRIGGITPAPAHRPRRRPDRGNLNDTAARAKDGRWKPWARLAEVGEKAVKTAKSD